MTFTQATRHSRFSENWDPRAKRRRARKPMGEMNVTPFIDVLLVLLIMIILAVPIKVNVTEVDLPSDRCAECVLNPEINTVRVSAQDELFWNGVSVTPDELRQQVSAASAMEQQPQLRFEPAALASYDRSARTIALIRESGADSFAFVGNAQHREFGR